MEELEEIEGERIGGVNFNNIRHSDDTVLIVNSQK